MAHFHNTFTRKSLLSAGEMVTEAQLAEEAKMVSFGKMASLVNRRSFLTTIAAGGAATTALAMAGCNNGTITPTTSGPTVVDVLNFALNLEYLEAQFYSYIVSGGSIPTADLGVAPGATSGGAKVTLVNTTVIALASALATHEREHVELLRAAISTLGGTPVDAPAINLAAMGAVTSDATFLAAARQLETVGVSAYAGGAQYLVSSLPALNYAAQILDTEAQHEGYLRELCIQLGVTSPAVDSQDQPPTSAKIFNTSATTGLNPVRTTSQVLQIAYAAPGQTGVLKGGFFPNGMNGNIKST